MGKLFDAVMESVRQDCAEALEALQTKTFRPEMMLTLIVRHPTNTEAELVVSSDEDLDAVQEVLKRSMRRRAAHEVNDKRGV